jgi:hypothetical protein
MKATTKLVPRVREKDHPSTEQKTYQWYEEDLLARHYADMQSQVKKLQIPSYISVVGEENYGGN